MTPTANIPVPQSPRRVGSINWLGLYTLIAKEIRRFLKVYFQTVIAPVVTTLLFLLVFALAFPARASVAGVDFLRFLAPGLVMMTMVQNAFANTSSSIIISKVQGNIVDVLMPPLSPLELTVGFAVGGVARGLVVGIVVGLAMMAIVPFHMAHPAFVIFHAIGASLMLSLLGMMGGIWADKFDHIAAVTNFLVTPLSFLSGTFYTLERLPETFRALALANPFFYMIDGFRYGFIGHADGSLAVGAGMVLAADIVLALATYWMFRRGYKLKA